MRSTVILRFVKNLEAIPNNHIVYMSSSWLYIHLNVCCFFHVKHDLPKNKVLASQDAQSETFNSVWVCGFLRQEQENG